MDKRTRQSIASWSKLTISPEEIEQKKLNQQKVLYEIWYIHFLCTQGKGGKGWAIEKGSQKWTFKGEIYQALKAALELKSNITHSQG